ncbi:MAG: alanine racemase [Alphaproteobacteria bacterium]|nr:alanine racemase [Alphaproteobacteria bacterium]
MTVSRSRTGFRDSAVLTIDLDAIAANYHTLRSRLAGGICAAVVKADAYGLGAARIAPVLQNAGCRHFFVALLDEAVALRAFLPQADIYVLNGLLPGSEATFHRHRLVPVLNDLSQITRWQTYSREHGPLGAAIHIDTGMNRLGLCPVQTDHLIAEPERLDGIDLLYIVSHLVRAEENDHPLNRTQLDTLSTALGRLPSVPVSFANSSGMFLASSFHFDLARPGAALYGVNPTPTAENPMRNAVRLEAPILQVRDVDSPMTVGYGATHKISKRGKLATISVGYADGYLRSLSSRGTCVVNGVRAPVVGRVSMDLITVDVSNVQSQSIKAGDKVEVLGPGHDINDLANEAGTIGYEILTSLGRRYRRRYVGG